MLRFKKDDGSGYPPLKKYTINEIFQEVTDYVAAGSFKDISENVKYLNEPDYAQLIRTYDIKSKFKNGNFVYVDEHAYSYLHRVQLDTSEFIMLPNIGANVGEVYFLTPSIFLHKKNVLGPNAILLKSNLNMKYLYGYFQTDTFKKNLSLIVSASGQPKFNKTDLKTMKIACPCTEEQNKIAEFLTEIDNVIECSEKEVESLEQQKKGLIQKIFSQEVRFKKENGNSYPGWIRKQFFEIMTCYSGGTPLVKNKEYYNGNIPFMRSGEIHDSKTKLYISEKGLKESSSKMIHKGDLIYALYGATSGEVSISKLDAAINQAILCIIPTLDNKRYLAEYLKFSRNKILSLFLQGGQGNLSAEIIKNLSIPLPCVEEQKKIADFLSSFDEAIDAAKEELETWKNIKKGLLQQMFE